MIGTILGLTLAFLGFIGFSHSYSNRGDSNNMKFWLYASLAIISYVGICVILVYGTL